MVKKKYKISEKFKVWGNGYQSELVARWEAPTLSGVPIVTMPNIPKPLHGRGMQPRTIFPSSEWRKMNMICKYKANYRCEVCGCEPPKQKLHAHELFSYDYEKGVGTFIRCVALCEKCHIRGIHSGRMFTMYRKGNPLMPKEKLLEGVENVFRLVSEYNKKNGTNLRVYDTFLDYLSDETLKDDMIKLIEKYHIKFYGIDEERSAPWSEWRVVVNGKEYHTPYKNYREWEKAMEETSKNDNMRNLADPFSGGIFDELKEFLEE